MAVGSQAKILRRAELSCFPTSGRMAVLLPPDNARIGQKASQHWLRESSSEDSLRQEKTAPWGHGFS
jgi:hypothetical protein